MLKKNSYWFIFMFMSAYIILFCLLGLYNWPMPGDDFGFAASVAQNGFWKAQYLMYMKWAGRIFNTFLVDLCVMLPLEKFYPFLAIINIITYIAAMYIFIKAIKPDIASLSVMLLTIIFTASTLSFTYSLHETFYWLAGSPYFWCTSLIMLAISFSVKALEGREAYFLLCLAVIFMNGTLLEQPSIFQGTIAFLATIYYIYTRDRKRAVMTGIFWAASVIAFLIIFLSPGTSIRMSSVAGAQSILQRTLRGILVAGVHGFFTAIKFFAKPIVYVPLLFLPAISSKVSNITLKAWHIIIITSLIAPAMQMLQSWSMGTGFPDRAVSLTLWSMGFTWCILWIFFYNGRLTKPSLASKYRWLALIIAIIISANSIDVINALRIAPAYRQEQQARAESISSQAASGVEDIIIPKITNRPAMIYSDLGVVPDSTFAEYYGAKSVMSLPEAMLEDREAISTLRSGSLAPLKPYAEAGDSDLQALLGWSSDPIYKTSNINNGLEVSLDEAERWDRMGAENGNLLCMRALSRVLYTKDKSIMQAMYWLLKYQLATIRL